MDFNEAAKPMVSRDIDMAVREPRKHGRQDQRGAVLVEMAIVLPLLLVLLVGAVDYGLILREYQILQNAAREGARLSILPQYCISSAPATDQAAVSDAIKQRVVDYLAQEQITIATTDVTVAQNIVVNIGGGLSATASKITVSYSRPVLIGNGWPFGPVALKAEATFRNYQCS
jgi:Flp pilus assembly protein TadG